MSSAAGDVRPYSVFVSYARRDDVGGWVTELVAALRREFETSDGQELRVFFDRSDITTPEEWKSKLSYALRQAPVMVACTSKNYFASQPCLWEFQGHEGRRRPGSKGSEELPPGLVPVFLEDVELEEPDEAHERWYAQVHRMQATDDLRGMFSREPGSVDRERLAGVVKRLAEQLRERWREIKSWERIDSNVGQGTWRFVGRQEELSRLDEVLVDNTSVGVVTAVEGFGGIGKTELVRYYSQQKKGYFAAGTWLLPAEGAREMLPLLARLAHDLPGFVVPEDARGNPEEAGRCVREELRRRSRDGQHVLLILDNVDQVSLLGAEQLGELPHGREFHVAATTRLGVQDLPDLPQLAHVPIGGLDVWESVGLLRALQPVRKGDDLPDFASEDEEQAAHELAELLGGFTLAVEQAGVYLLSNQNVTVREYLEHLRKHGALAGDELTESGTREQAAILHKQKLLGVILGDTLKSLDESCPGSVEVLKLAAAMPSDMIPWPWLEALARDVVPEVFEASRQHLKGRWDQIRGVLEGRRLIEEGTYPGITGRMHRLVAEHLNQGNGALLEGIDEYVMARADHVQSDFSSPSNRWEVDALLDALARPLAFRPERFGEIPNFFAEAAAHVTDARPGALVEAVVEALPRDSGRIRVAALLALRDLVGQVDPGRALGLAEEALEIAQVLVGEQPGSLEARRDLTVSLNRVGDLVAHSDPGRALGLAEESLEVARVLVGEQPQSLQARRDLTASLDRVVDLVAHSDPGRALGLAEESLEVARVLAEAQPGNTQVLWDLGVAAARMALLVPDSPELGSRWREAAVSFRAALEIRPDHPRLGWMSWDSARRYAETGPSDRDEWLAYAAELAERFGLAN
ncbi:toll/interleukin-1 receptor domain-containing protein [Tessaracoccus sp. OH4464_COT-324]|uniref:tetratricopeptide repeat protein n=1 Tax=Tessaracoccus sp. OH4464_COT-324 TaxID=2491059 RepID=UPI00131A1557|nr:toll/interleukin-1 receptor domain-containing protein [Tessaracoccus sp. OH4464_COT-324]